MRPETEQLKLAAIVYVDIMFTIPNNNLVGIAIFIYKNIIKTIKYAAKTI